MTQIDGEILQRALDKYMERFNALIENALIRNEVTTDLADAVPGMQPKDAAIFIFLKLVPEMLERTTMLSKEGKVGLGNQLIDETKAVLQRLLLDGTVSDYVN